MAVERKLELCSNGYLPITQQYTPTADLLRKPGLTVEVTASDWGNLTIRRAAKKPVDQGGWSLFGTSWFGADMLHPGLNGSLRTNGAAAWLAGQKMTNSKPCAASEWDDRSRGPPRVSPLQERAFEVVPYIRPDNGNDDRLPQEPQKDLVLGPVIFQWGVEKL
jgi:peptide/nickel transport system substrate-binding protein